MNTIYYINSPNGNAVPVGFSINGNDYRTFLDLYKSGEVLGLCFQVQPDFLKLVINEPTGLPIDYLPTVINETTQHIYLQGDYYNNAYNEYYNFFNEVINSYAVNEYVGCEVIPKNENLSISSQFQVSVKDPAIPDANIINSYREQINTVVDTDDIVDNPIVLLLYNSEEVTDEISNNISSYIESIAMVKVSVFPSPINRIEGDINVITEVLKTVQLQGTGYTHMSYYDGDIIKSIKVFCEMYGYECPAYLIQEKETQDTQESSQVQEVHTQETQVQEAQSTQVQDNQTKIALFNYAVLDSTQVHELQNQLNEVLNDNVLLFNFDGTLPIDENFDNNLREWHKFGEDNGYKYICYVLDNVNNTVEKFKSFYGLNTPTDTPNEENNSVALNTLVIKEVEVDDNYVQTILNTLQQTYNESYQVNYKLLYKIDGNAEQVANTIISIVNTYPDYNYDRIIYIRGSELNYDTNLANDIYKLMYLNNSTTVSLQEVEEQPKSPSFKIVNGSLINENVIYNYFTKNNIVVDFNLESPTDVIDINTLEGNKYISCINYILDRLGIETKTEYVVYSNYDQPQNCICIPIGDTTIVDSKDAQTKIITDGCYTNEHMQFLSDILYLPTDDTSDTIVVISNEKEAVKVDNNILEKIKSIGHKFLVISSDIIFLTQNNDPMWRYDYAAKRFGEEYKVFIVSSSYNDLEEYDTYYGLSLKNEEPQIEQIVTSQGTIPQDTITPEPQIQEPVLNNLSTNFGGTEEGISGDNPYIILSDIPSDIPSDIVEVINNPLELYTKLTTSDLTWLANKLLPYAPTYINKLVERFSDNLTRLLYINKPNIPDNEFMYNGKHLFIYLLEAIYNTSNLSDSVIKLAFGYMKSENNEIEVDEIDDNDDDSDDDKVASATFSESAVNSLKAFNYIANIYNNHPYLYRMPNKIIQIDSKSLLPSVCEEFNDLSLEYCGISNLSIELYYDIDNIFGDINFYISDKLADTNAINSIVSKINNTVDVISLGYMDSLTDEIVTLIKTGNIRTLDKNNLKIPSVNPNLVLSKITTYINTACSMGLMDTALYYFATENNLEVETVTTESNNTLYRLKDSSIILNKELIIQLYNYMIDYHYDDLYSDLNSFGNFLSYSLPISKYYSYRDDVCKTLINILGDKAIKLPDYVLELDGVNITANDYLTEFLFSLDYNSECLDDRFKIYDITLPSERNIIGVIGVRDVNNANIQKVMFYLEKTTTNIGDSITAYPVVSSTYEGKPNVVNDGGFFKFEVNSFNPPPAPPGVDRNISMLPIILDIFQPITLNQVRISINTIIGKLASDAKHYTICGLSIDKFTTVNFPDFVEAEMDLLVSYLRK